MKKIIQFIRFTNILSKTTPDTVYINGDIITMNPQMPSANAVAVKNGKITAVGSNEKIKQITGKKTKVIDLNGKTLIPGFIEPHSHLAMYGSVLTGVDCYPRSNKNMDEILEKISAAAKKTPKSKWITGWGYDDTMTENSRHLTKEDLDKAAPDHNVFISHISGHIAYVNSKLLSLAGIDKDTPDPEGGEYGRFENGEPNGLIAETPAMMKFYNLMPQPSVREILKGLILAGRDYTAQGITTANDGGFMGIAPLVAYRKAQKSGKFHIRIYANLFAMMLEFFEKKNITLKKLGVISGSGDEWLKIGAAKLIQDGSIQGFTAALKQPYHTKPDYKGYLTMSQEEINKTVLKYHKAGFQVQIHGNGDAAIESNIKAIENALKVFPRKDHRHQIIHCQTASDEQLDKMAELGISANFFPVHIHYWGDRHYKLFLGPERAERIDPLKSAEERGILFSMHSDCPVTPVSPLMSIYAAVNRKTSSGRVLGSSQRISVQKALEALTVNSAKMIFEEHSRGSIEPGKLADFAVLSENPLSVKPEKIKDIIVEKTIVDGKIIYTARGN